MILLDTLTLTSLEWGILTFFLLQLITGIKFINSLYTRIRLLENDLVDNRKDDEKGDTEMKRQIESFRTEIRSELEKRDDTRNYQKNLFFKELKRIEEKSNLNDKESTKRIDGIAQGLVKAETKIETIEKYVHKN